MSNILEYKGYHTKVTYDAESGLLRGKIEGISDFVDFEATTESVEAEFHSAVDDYLSFCEEVGKCPDKEYKGSFNIRIDPSLHRDLAIEANKKDISLNQVIENALFEHVHGSQHKTETILYIKDNETKSTFPMSPFMIKSANLNYGV